MAKCSASYTLTIVSDGQKGDTGSQGYGIVAAVQRPSFTESQWTLYGTIGHTENWSATESVRNGCRIGDLFLVVGTATDTGKAHTLTYRSDTDSGNLHGVCIAHNISDKGDKGEQGSAGTPAKVFSLTCDRTSVIRNDRLSYSMDYNFTIEVQGYSGLVVLKVNGTEKTLTQSGTKYTLKYSLPLKDAQALTVVAYLEGAEMARLELDVVDKTQSNRFLGSLDALPTETDYGSLLDGDYFVPFVDIVSDGVTYTMNVTYIRSNGQWSAMDSDASDFSSRLLECLGGILDSGNDIRPSDVVMYQFVKNLAAQTIVANEILSNNISSSNFEEDSQGFYATKGYKLEAENGPLLGLIRSADARFYNINIKGGVIEDVSIQKNASGTNNILFKTQEEVPSIQFSANSETGTLMEESYLTDSRLNDKEVVKESHKYNYYGIYLKLSTTQQTATYTYADFSFTAGFSGHYIFKGPPMPISLTGVTSTMTITVDGASYTSISKSEDGSSVYANEVEIPIQEGQTVSVSFSKKSFYYLYTDIVGHSAANQASEAWMKIKDFTDKYTGETISWEKNVSYYMTKQYCQAADLYVRSPFMVPGKEYYNGSKLNSIGVMVGDGSQYVNPVSVSFRLASTSNSTYNAFASLSLNAIARLSSSISLTYKGKTYSGITRVQKTDSSLTFMNDSQSLVSIPKDNDWSFSVPVCSTKVEKAGIVAPTVYTTGSGVGQIGTQDECFNEGNFIKVRGGLMAFAGNEVCLGVNSTDVLYINYRSANNGSTSDGATKITAYRFCDRKGALADIYGKNVYGAVFN